MRAASPPLVAMVAAEPSGDYLGARLIGALSTRRPELRFAGIGGPQMIAAGFDSWHPMETLSVRGYVEVLRHYPAIAAIRRQLIRRLSVERPALFVGIDAPDFNLKVARAVKRGGNPAVQYVSPSIWAWRPGRIRAIADSVDQVLALFPFEVPLYLNAGVAAAYVGHPLADEIPLENLSARAREQLRVPPGRRVLALLPGSRNSELQYMADLYVRAAMLIARKVPDAWFLVPLATRATREQFEAAMYRAGATDLPMVILFGHAREAIAASDVALIASGTATLEAALYRKPMVITYRMAEGSWMLMSRMRLQPYVGLPNIIAGEFIVPELLQHDATPENLAQALVNLLGDSVVRDRLAIRLADMHHLLRRDAARSAAEALLAWLPRS